jgi:hypothetical protein
MKRSVKINYKDSFIPYNLFENLIKEGEPEVEKITVEEEDGELYYETVSGLGKIYFKNNTIYEGNLKYGILDNGEDNTICKISFPNGTTYEGDIHNNQITGVGKYLFDTGSR